MVRTSLRCAKIAAYCAYTVQLQAELFINYNAHATSTTYKIKKNLSVHCTLHVPFIPTLPFSFMG